MMMASPMIVGVDEAENSAQQQPSQPASQPAQHAFKTV